VIRSVLLRLGNGGMAALTIAGIRRVMRSALLAMVEARRDEAISCVIRMILEVNACSESACG